MSISLFRQHNRQRMKLRITFIEARLHDKGILILGSTITFKLAKRRYIHSNVHNQIQSEVQIPHSIQEKRYSNYFDPLSAQLRIEGAVSSNGCSPNPPEAGVEFQPRYESVVPSDFDRNVLSAMLGRTSSGLVGECILVLPTLIIWLELVVASPPLRGISAGLVRVNNTTFKNPESENTMSANVVTPNGTSLLLNAENRATATGIVVMVYTNG